MRKNSKQGVILPIFIIVLIIIIVIGFFVPRNSFTPTETKKKNTSFGQFSSSSNTQTGNAPAPLKWKKSFVYEKENNSSNKSQSYMQYMMDKNKK